MTPPLCRCRRHSRSFSGQPTALTALTPIEFEPAPPIGNKTITENNIQFLHRSHQGMIESENLYTWLIDDEPSLTALPPTFRCNLFHRSFMCPSHSNRGIFHRATHHFHPTRRGKHAPHHLRKILTRLAIPLPVPNPRLVSRRKVWNLGPLDRPMRPRARRLVRQKNVYSGRS